MGKKSKKTEEAPDDVEAEGAEGSEDKKKSKARPRSGTETLLMSNRRTATENLAKASKAEKAYRTKKKATMARANYTETKEHFKEAWSHFKMAFKGFFKVLGSIGALVGEKSENRRLAAENKKREKNLERKKKLEEQLAKDMEEGNAGEES
ncbi:hypothetical protein F53441_4123 [Fusarium austroafricanum]|uniref:Uncharacterized protein n=1 Tax=Fusarium austroafricanum TaxID=2364996 RepID=A0A8H4KML9_9HYPO|nr:hypothetical protein F53441_4123 [Fusarium austroafricanum]